MRAEVAAIWLGLASGCSFELLGSGADQGGDESVEPGTSTSTAGATDDGGSGIATSLGTLGGQTGGDDSTGAPMVDTGDAGTSSTDTGDPPLPDLVSDGVIARYYLDEDVNGQSVSDVVDAVEPAVDMPIEYVETNPHYIEIDGHRGLAWDTEGVDGGPSVMHGGTKFRDALHGKPDGTIEVVADIRAITQQSSRLLHFGFGDQGGRFTLASNEPEALQFRTRTGGETARFPVDVTNLGRTVYTLTFDSQVAMPEERVHLYVDGVEVPPQAVDPMLSGQTIDLDNMGSVALGNRANGSRSFRGVLYYAAVYERALTSDEAATNAAILLQSDDSP